MKQFDDDNIRAAGHEAGAIADMGHRAEVDVRRPNIPVLYAEVAGAAVDRGNPANPYFQGRLARSLQVVFTDIHRLQGESKVDGAIDAERAARVLLACWEGLQFQWQHGPEFDFRAHLEWIIKAVLGPHALTPPREQPEP